MPFTWRLLALPAAVLALVLMFGLAVTHASEPPPKGWDGIVGLTTIGCDAPADLAEIAIATEEGDEAGYAAFARLNDDPGRTGHRCEAVLVKHVILGDRIALPDVRLLDGSTVGAWAVEVIVTPEERRWVLWPDFRPPPPGRGI